MKGLEREDNLFGVSEKKWTVRGVNKVISQHIATGEIRRKPVSGRPKTAQTEENTAELLSLTESQESDPGTSFSLRKAAQFVCIGAASASRASRGAGRKSAR